MSKHYLVTLTEDERAALDRRMATGRGSAREHTHARIPLKADAGPRGPAWTDDHIAGAMEVGLSTVARVRRRFIEHGLDAAIRRRPPRREYRRKLDGEQEAHLRSRGPYCACGSQRSNHATIRFRRSTRRS